jgi:hypothetical protein
MLPKACENILRISEEGKDFEYFFLLCDVGVVLCLFIEYHKRARLFESFIPLELYGSDVV